MSSHSIQENSSSSLSVLRPLPTCISILIIFNLSCMIFKFWAIHFLNVIHVFYLITPFLELFTYPCPSGGRVDWPAMGPPSIAILPIWFLVLFILLLFQVGYLVYCNSRNFSFSSLKKKVLLLVIDLELHPSWGRGTAKVNECWSYSEINWASVSSIKW